MALALAQPHRPGCGGARGRRSRLGPARLPPSGAAPACRGHRDARANTTGAVPSTEAGCSTLPGVGVYTAAAVAAFAFGERTTVVDTNVRRVLARSVPARPARRPSLTRAERPSPSRLVPADPRTAATWNVAVMELGALVCTARGPRCEACPLAALCAWQQAGRPAYEGPPRRGQAWHGTDRQARGALLAVLRERTTPVARAALAAAVPDASQRERCLDSLVSDGLVEPLARGRFRLPGTP